MKTPEEDRELVKRATLVAVRMFAGRVGGLSVDSLRESVTKEAKDGITQAMCGDILEIVTTEFDFCKSRHLIPSWPEKAE